MNAIEITMWVIKNQNGNYFKSAPNNRLRFVRNLAYATKYSHQAGFDQLERLSKRAFKELFLQKVKILLTEVQSSPQKERELS